MARSISLPRVRTPLSIGYIMGHPWPRRSFEDGVLCDSSRLSTELCRLHNVYSASKLTMTGIQLLLFLKQFLLVLQTPVDLALGGNSATVFLLTPCCVHFLANIIENTL